MFDHYLPSAILRTVAKTFEEYDISNDPYVIYLRYKADIETLFKVYSNGKTYCTDQLRTLKQKMELIASELGLLAAERFVRLCISDYIVSLDKPHSMSSNVKLVEKLYVADLLKPILKLNSLSNDLFADATPKSLTFYLTDKAKVLVDILQREHTTLFRGIIFVEQRATVAALQDLISIHPDLKDKYRIGISVGESDHSERSSALCRSIEIGDKGRSLKAFRTGDINLLLATSVLEEGVDVPECHVIICFDSPKNLKSFVQRRGRARKEDSKYFILCQEGTEAAESSNWEELESLMVSAYLDDTRSHTNLSTENSPLERRRVFRVKDSNALLTPENSMAHLYHFCSKLEAGSHIHLRPQFSYEEIDGGIIGHVRLPTAVPPHIRTAQGSLPSVSHKNAKKEAAFEAMIKLHENGLTNRNLLPIISGPEFNRSLGVVTGMVPAPIKYDPWKQAASAAKQNSENSSNFYPYLVAVTELGIEKWSLVVVSRFKWPQIPDFDLFWTKKETYVLSVSPLPPCNISGTQLDNIAELSKIILQSAFPAAYNNEPTDYLMYVIPPVPVEDIKDVLESVKGNNNADHLIGNEDFPAAVLNGGLIRYGPNQSRYILRRRAQESDLDSAGMMEGAVDFTRCLVAVKFPRRRDFHSMAYSHALLNKSPESILQVDQCKVDRLPTKYSICALFVPSLLRRLELAMVTDGLNLTLLQPLEIRTLSLVQTAITATAAREPENYERFEYLGDCILKFLSSIQLLHENPYWSEGYLSAAKSRLVSNSNLAEACMKIGLDKFLITDQWVPTPARVLAHFAWKTVPDPMPTPRPRSTKTTADIVESLLGASFLDGGLKRAQRCLRILLPYQQWTDVDIAVGSLHLAADSATSHMELPEKIIGYKFTKTSLLLEAFTHPSFHSYSDDQTISYQRLEFLGDGLLDYLVVQKIFPRKATLDPGVMTQLRAALTNADFLGFLCLELSMQEELFDISMSSDGGVEPNEERRSKSLWQFMRYTSEEIMGNMQATAERHMNLQKQIKSALLEDDVFPWGLLARLSPEKVFSDLIESLLGAIFVDSRGDMAPCSAFLDRLGMFTVLERLIDDQVICLHPINQLTSQGHKQVSVTYDFGNTREAEDKILEVRIGGQSVGPAGVRVKGSNKFSMMTIAASEALRVLDSQKGEEKPSNDALGTEDVHMSSPDIRK
jgi:dsRNA-specific ribonuclease